MYCLAHLAIFFWFVIFRVHKSAVRRVLMLLVLGRTALFQKKLTLPTENWMVLVAWKTVPFLVVNFGFVYSPTLSK
jgi:hypothetical protein